MFEVLISGSAFRCRKKASSVIMLNQKGKRERGKGAKNALLKDLDTNRQGVPWITGYFSALLENGCPMKRYQILSHKYRYIPKRSADKRKSIQKWDRFSSIRFSEQFPPFFLHTSNQNPLKPLCHPQYRLKKCNCPINSHFCR